jgi:hypothetical protein
MAEQNDKEAIQIIESYLRLFSKAEVFSHLDPKTKIADILDMCLSADDDENVQTIKSLFENALCSSALLAPSKKIGFFDTLKMRDGIKVDISPLVEYFKDRCLVDYKQNAESILVLDSLGCEIAKDA